jgi:FG-GAP-like repeat/PASTA domain
VAAVVLLVLVGSAGAAESRDSRGPTFARGKYYATAWSQGRALAMGDLTGDGWPDLVSAVTLPSHNLSVLINGGDGTFRAKPVLASGRNPASVAIGDVDGDRAEDIVTANSVGTVSVLLGKGDGTFRARRDYVTGGTPSSVAIGDLNGDGKLDAVTAISSAQGGISVLLNAGDGSFQPARDFGAGFAADKLAIGDLNGDGSLDLTVGGEDALGYPRVAVFLNAGDGSFPASRTYSATSDPKSIAVGDINGDGRPDLVWTTSEEETGPGFVVQLNRGRGRFGEGKGYGLHGDGASGGSSVAIGDLNGDGQVEVAVTSRIHAVSVSVRSNAGGFRSQLDYGTARYPAVVLAGDLNGDRKQDLVVATDLGIAVLLNRPRLCNVQDLRRQTLVQARQTLARVNCRLGKVSYAYSRTIRGHVIGQTPKLGAVLRGGSKVNLVVSRGSH